MTEHRSRSPAPAIVSPGAFLFINNHIGLDFLIKNRYYLRLSSTLHPEFFEVIKHAIRPLKSVGKVVRSRR
jgi:hypothetical protein